MRMTSLVLSLLVVWIQSSMAFSADVTIVTRFSGNKGPGWKSSIDVAGAVGPRHVVDFDVAGFVVHDKSSGEILRRLSTREFWQQVQPVGTLMPQQEANDARILYDPLSQRWFACAAGTTAPDCFLAVSSSPDPLQPWRGVNLPLPRINPYMKMGVDRNGLYICSCNGNPDMKQGTNCFVLPKQDVIGDKGPVLTHGQTFENLQFSAMPALDPDPDKPADAPAILLANEFFEGQCGELYLYRITWQGTKASISDVQTIPLKKIYLTPDNSTPQMEAFQPPPGPKLRAGGGGRRIDSAFVLHGSVFGCNGAKRTAESRPGILWYEVRISDGALIQESLVDSAERDFIFPSIAVDSQGNIGIGCTGTSQTEFPSVYVMMHAATDPLNLMRQPVCAVPGTTVYRSEGASAVNLSHYSSTCIDPADPALLWTYQAYANSKIDKQWCTAWAAFQLPAAKPANTAKQTTFPRGHDHHPQAGEKQVAQEQVIRSVKSGLWSSPATWIGGRVPGAGSRVLIRSGHRIVYDVQSEQAIRGIHVSGELSFATDRDTRLDVGLINIQAGDEYSETGFDCAKHFDASQSTQTRPVVRVIVSRQRRRRGFVNLDRFAGRRRLLGLVAGLTASGRQSEAQQQKKQSGLHCVSSCGEGNKRVKQQRAHPRRRGVPAFWL